MCVGGRRNQMSCGLLCVLSLDHQRFRNETRATFPEESSSLLEIY